MEVDGERERERVNVVITCLCPDIRFHFFLDYKDLVCTRVDRMTWRGGLKPQILTPGNNSLHNSLIVPSHLCTLTVIDLWYLMSIYNFE